MRRCIDTVTKALKGVDGVKDVAVSLHPGQARIDFDENTTSHEYLRAAVQQAGYKPDVTADQSKAKGGGCS